MARHTKKFDDCVAKVRKKGGAIDPYAICQKALGTRSYVKNPFDTKPEDVKKATKLFREFREQAPKRGRAIEFEVPKIVMVMGTVTSIEYDTTRRGKVEKYRHTFNAGSKPVLCANGADGQLFILEGRYHVTPRGIVDLDASGKELE